jgi:conjugal transfer pilus assembly protein TraF
MFKRACIAALFVATTSQASSPPSDFYEDSRRGWFWFEDPEQIEEALEEELPLPSQETENSEKSESELVRLDVAWLRDKIPEYRDEALNKPTRENIARFMYAQRYMLDMSTRFANAAMDFSKFEPELDESRRRPWTTFSLNAFKDETRTAVRDVLSAINENTHIWFFFSSDCNFCVQQIGVLKEMKARFDINVLAVSLDGGTLPGLDGFEMVVDTNGVAQEFGVQFTPTLLLAENGGENFTRLGEGLTALPVLQDRLLVAARMQNLITNEQYQLTQNVRDINVLYDVDGEMLADAELLESDPGYLAELLRSKLGSSRPAGSQEFDFNVETQQ